MSKKTTYIIFIVLLLLGIVSAFNLFGGKNIPNNGNTINAVGTNIRQTGNELNAITSGINQIEGTSQSIEQSACRIEELNGSSAELIAKCKQIIRDVRERNQSGTAASEN